jgi:hypothetical protein
MTLFCICEALELFDVKFIKQNITGKITDLENLTLQIRSVQLEHEHMMILFSEFVEDNIVPCHHAKKGSPIYGHL